MSTSALARLRAGLDLGRLLVSGAPAERRRTTSLQNRLRMPMTLTCRLVVVPTQRSSGATTAALHLASTIAHARRLPTLMVSASPGPASAADHLPYARPWPQPTAPGPTPSTGEHARELTGVGPDGLISCLRLPEDPQALPLAWHSVRRELMRFFDLAVTETGPLPAGAVQALGVHHDAIVLVSPAQRRQVEQTRDLITDLRASLRAPAHSARSPQILHLIIARTSGPPLVPALQDEEYLIGYDPVLRGTQPGRTLAPGFLAPTTARTLARLGGDIVASVGRSQEAQA